MSGGDARGAGPHQYQPGYSAEPDATQRSRHHRRPVVPVPTQAETPFLRPIFSHSTHVQADPFLFLVSADPFPPVPIRHLCVTGCQSPRGKAAPRPGVGRATNRPTRVASTVLFR